MARLDEGTKGLDVSRWRSRHGLTIKAAADAIGVSRNSLHAYEADMSPLPRVVRLAMVGWEKENQK